MFFAKYTPLTPEQIAAQPGAAPQSVSLLFETLIGRSLTAT